MNYRYLMLVLLGCVSLSCYNKKLFTADGYRYVTWENIPFGEWGKVIGEPAWDSTHYINKPSADSFYIYGNFDSIRMKAPAESFGEIFRKIEIHAKVWKPEPRYGELYFKGTYETDNLPGMFVTYYFTKDRSSILRINYTDPGSITSAVLFSKTKEHILKQQGIVIDPRKELR